MYKGYDARFTNETFVWNYLIDEIKDVENTDEYIERYGDSLIVKPETIINDAWESNRASSHYKFSPSKSPGWAICAAYMDRAVQWNGSREPAIRGTFGHYILERLLLALGLSETEISESEAKKLSDELPTLMWFLYERPDLVIKTGVPAILAAIKYADEIKVDTGFGWWSELSFCNPTITDEDGGVVFGGSIDMLHVDPIGKVIRVLDLKTGKHMVSPESWQLRCYGMLTVFNLQRGSKEPTVTTVTARMAERFGSEDIIGDPNDYRFIIGVAQAGKIILTEYSYSDIMAFEGIVKQQIIRVDEYKREGLRLMKGTAGGDEECKKFPHLFERNPQCRFCSGCYKLREQY